MSGDPNRGWFSYDGHPGDRTLEQQLRGLDPLLAGVKGKAVLDVGCAEGLIALELLRHGAAMVRGVEIVARHVEAARALAVDHPWSEYVHADANEYRPAARSYDIVIMLALLHKLKDPSVACVTLADATTDLCVIRLPPTGLVINDARSKNIPHDVGATMLGMGFRLEQTTLGPFDEPTYYWRR